MIEFVSITGVRALSDDPDGSGLPASLVPWANIGQGPDDLTIQEMRIIEREGFVLRELT